MYAVVANGKTSIVETQSELNKILAVYTYSKWHYCNTNQEAIAWLRSNQRGQYDYTPYMFGDTTHNSVLVISYFITEDSILFNVDTSKFGMTRVCPDDYDGIKVDNRPNLLKVKVINTKLNNMIISHHCIAIRRILTIIGEFCDVCFILPDMSVYIALTKYKGKDALIRKTQDFIKSRLGGVSYTVDNIYRRRN